MGRKPSTEKKKGTKRLKRGPKLGSKDLPFHSESEMHIKRKTKVSGKFSVSAKIDMDAVTSEDVVTPKTEDGEVVLDVECGPNKAILFLSKLCQGSKGPCISFQGSWLTPNEFQFVSGRETAKDWKRSIRHNGKSIKLLMAKDILIITANSSNEATSERNPEHSVMRPERRLSALTNTESFRDENEDICEAKPPSSTDDPKDKIVPTEDKENVSADIMKCKLVDENKSKDKSNDGDDDSTTEDPWEGSSDTTELVDYDFDKTGFEEENVISENDARKAVSKLKTTNDNLQSNIFDEVAEKISPSNSNKILEKQTNDLMQKAETLDCNHISEKEINGDRKDYKNKDINESQTCSLECNAQGNEGNVTNSSNDSQQLSNIPVLKIKKKRFSKKTKPKKIEPKQSKCKTSKVKTKKRNKKKKLHNCKEVEIDETRSSETVNADVQGSAEHNNTDEYMTSTESNARVSDKSSCPRESRLGSIIDQLRESKARVHVDKEIGDTTKEDLDSNVDQLEKMKDPNCSTQNKDVATTVKKSDSNREKSPRKHTHVKRSPYYMKKEAKQKFSEIFENEKDSFRKDNDSEEEQKRVIVKTSSACVINNCEKPDISLKTETLDSEQDANKNNSEKTNIIKTDENRNQFQSCKKFNIDSIISTNDCSTVDKVAIVKNSTNYLAQEADESKSLRLAFSASHNISSNESTVTSVPSTATSPNRTTSPLSRKDHILQRTGSPRNSETSPKPNHNRSPDTTYNDRSHFMNPTDQYNEYMKALAARYMVPNPALYDQFRGVRSRSLDVPFHPGFVHPYLCPGFVEQKHNPVSVSAARPQSMKSKLVTSPKEASSAVLDLTRLNNPVRPQTRDKPKHGEKRTSESTESVLDLSVKRLKTNTNGNYPHISMLNGKVDPYYNLTSHATQGYHRKGHKDPQTKYDLNVKQWLNANTKHWSSKTEPVKSEPRTCQCAENNSKDIRNWSIDRVSQFLHSLEGCSQYIKVFRDNRISGKYLPYLTTDQLVLHLGMKVSPAMVLCEAVTTKVLELRKYSIPCTYCKSKTNGRISL